MISAMPTGGTDAIMIEMTNLSEIRFESSDLGDLGMLLKQLVGQPTLGFRVSYGDELTLHLGDPRPYASPFMKGKHRGSYVIGARASSWYVSSTRTSSLLTSDDLEGVLPMHDPRRVDIKKVEDLDLVSVGQIVTSARPYSVRGDFALSLGFSDGSRFVILPPAQSGDDHPAEDESLMEIATWEVLTPHARVLRVGPGNRWSYLDSSPKVAD